MAYAHFWIGTLFLFVFLGSGQWMERTFPTPTEQDMGERMMYRSAHVYVLISAMLNWVSAGSATPQGAFRRTLALLGSLAILAAPALFTIAFIVEPEPGRLFRPWCLSGAITVLAGSALRLMTTPWGVRKSG